MFVVNLVIYTLERNIVKGSFCLVRKGYLNSLIFTRITKQVIAQLVSIDNVRFFLNIMDL